MVAKEKMKCAFIKDFNGIDGIEIGELESPEPKANEIQIEIAYAGVNPVDWKIAEGRLKATLIYEFPIILGWDVSGKVSKVGKEVKNFKEGDAVFGYCRKETCKEGSFAEYICVEEKHVVKIPQTISFAEAASIALSALTAWQSLFDTGGLKAKETVLIHAGAGGVGGFAIQLAKWAGARVITTTSASNKSYVESFQAADLIIDYTQENLIDAIKAFAPEGVDLVFDTVGGETLKASYEMVKKGGRVISIADIIDSARAKEYDVKADAVFVKPDDHELSQIATLIEEKQLLPPKIEEVPLDEIKSALRKSREGHTQGKMVLKIK